MSQFSSSLFSLSDPSLFSRSSSSDLHVLLLAGSSCLPAGSHLNQFVQLLRELLLPYQAWGVKFTFNVDCPPNAVYNLLRENTPDVVQIYGRMAEDSIVLSSLQLQTSVVNSVVRLRQEATRKHIRCVLLTACHSDVIASPLAEHVPWVLGAGLDVTSTQTRVYSSQWYHQILRGRDVITAHKAGCLALKAAEGSADDVMALDDNSQGRGPFHWYTKLPDEDRKEPLYSFPEARNLPSSSTTSSPVRSNSSSSLPPHLGALQALRRLQSLLQLAQQTSSAQQAYGDQVAGAVLALCNSFSDNGGMGEPNAVAKAEGITAALGAMRQYPQSNVQSGVLRLLEMLTNEVNHQYRLRALEQGIIKEIVTALKQTLLDPAARRTSFFLLFRFTADKTLVARSVEYFRAAGGPQLLGAYLQHIQGDASVNNSEEQEVLQRALGLLDTLLESRRIDEVEQWMHDKGLGCVLSLLRETSSEDVARRTLEVIYAFAQLNPGNQDLILLRKNDGASVILKAMQNRPSSMWVFEAGCAVLLTLISSTKERKAAVAKCDPVPTLLVGMRETIRNESVNTQHTDVTKGLSKACLLLESFGKDSNQIQQSLLQIENTHLLEQVKQLGEKRSRRLFDIAGRLLQTLLSDARVITSAITDALKTLSAAVQQVKLNQQQCRLLYNRVYALLPPIQRLSEAELRPRSPVLVSLLHYIEAITSFITQQSQYGYLRHLMQGPDDQPGFTQYHQALNQLNQDLNLSLGTDSHFDQGQVLLAQQQDALYLRIRLPELISQLKDLDEKQMERDGSMKIFVDERYHSMKYALNTMIKQMQQRSTTTQPAASSIFHSIPFFDLTMEEKIGSGSFGDVYRGVWKKMDKTVAIKVLKGELTDEVKQEFIREVQLMYDIRGYDHVVNLQGACIDDTKYCLVMEYVANGSLFSLISREIAQNWSWPVKCDIAYQMVNSVNYLHCLSPPILHRDIKSPNFLITEHLTVKVCDFGLARVRQEATQSSVTSTGFSGTIAYSAPEQLAFGTKKPRYNEKCDVYSLGIVLWELATGRVPYEGSSPAHIVGLVTSGQRMDIPESVPSYFKPWITQCWSQNPNDRPTCELLMQQIKPYRSQTAAAISPSHHVDHGHIATTLQGLEPTSLAGTDVPPSSSHDLSFPSSSPPVSSHENAILNLMALGFDRVQVITALAAASNNPDRAAELLLSMSSSSPVAVADPAPSYSIHTTDPPAPNEDRDQPRAADQAHMAGTVQQAKSTSTDEKKMPPPVPPRPPPPYRSSLDTDTSATGATTTYSPSSAPSEIDPFYVFHLLESFEEKARHIAEQYHVTGYGIAGGKLCVYVSSDEHSTTLQDALVMAFECGADRIVVKCNDAHRQTLSFQGATPCVCGLNTPDSHAAGGVLGGFFQMKLDAHHMDCDCGDCTRPARAFTAGHVLIPTVSSHADAYARCVNDYRSWCGKAVPFFSPVHAKHDGTGHPLKLGQASCLHFGLTPLCNFSTDFKSGTIAPTPVEMFVDLAMTDALDPVTSIKLKYPCSDQQYANPKPNGIDAPDNKNDMESEIIYSCTIEEMHALVVELQENPGDQPPWDYLLFCETYPLRVKLIHPLFNTFVKDQSTPNPYLQRVAWYQCFPQSEQTEEGHCGSLLVRPRQSGGSWVFAPLGIHVIHIGTNCYGPSMLSLMVYIVRTLFPVRLTWEAQRKIRFTFYHPAAKQLRKAVQSWREINH